MSTWYSNMTSFSLRFCFVILQVMNSKVSCSFSIVLFLYQKLMLHFEMSPSMQAVTGMQGALNF